MTKKEMVKRKQQIAYLIRNIKSDYSGVLPEDMPDDISTEIAELMSEMTSLRTALEELATN